MIGEPNGESSEIFSHAEAVAVISEKTGVTPEEVDRVFLKVLRVKATNSWTIDWSIFDDEQAFILKNINTTYCVKIAVSHARVLDRSSGEMVPFASLAFVENVQTKTEKTKFTPGNNATGNILTPSGGGGRGKK